MGVSAACALIGKKNSDIEVGNVSSKPGGAWRVFFSCLGVAVCAQCRRAGEANVGSCGECDLCKLSLQRSSAGHVAGALFILGFLGLYPFHVAPYVLRRDYILFSPQSK